MARWLANKTLALCALVALGATSLGVTSCRKSSDGGALSVVQHASRKTLTAFGSEAELTSFLNDLKKAQVRERQAQPSEQAPAGAEAAAEPAQAAPSPTSASDSDGKASSESVTNTQHAGVDEGGIVKVHGNHLVVLRRGRLFSVNVGDDALTPVSSVDAFGPDIDPSGTWYDEMLVAGDTIAVIGYSYQRGGTEIGLFDINAAGSIRYRSTYHLRSNDYYSSRNYASRLIGSKLIFYTPLYLSLDGNDVFSSFPALRKWHKGAKDDEFKRIVSATRVYRPIMASPTLALHTVTVCDLAQRDFSCQANAVLGPPGRVFYVSPASVFVWMTDWDNQGGVSRPRSLVYRLPLDGSSPSALRVSGAPVDQFSFLESPDGYLNVLVRSEAQGDGMWSAEVAQGDVAMLRVPLESFSDGADSVPSSRYRVLPKAGDNGYAFQNRFVGSYLLYGTGSGWGSPDQSQRGLLVAYPYAGGEPTRLTTTHGVDRIEALGSDAIIVGTDGTNLHFTPVSLGARPSLAERYTRKNASQGELRSHGFFYKPENEHSGMLGLPISEAGRPGYEHLTQGSASVLFLKNDFLRLSELGPLAARAENPADDACRASCVDWYGNARPLFLKGRIFALLGYELVEGQLDGGRIHEVRRVSYAPRPAQIAR